MQVIFEFSSHPNSALVLCNARGIDPLDPLTKLIDELTSKRPRTEADDAQISRLEWQRGLYYDQDIGIYVPSANLMRCLRNAGNLVEKNKGGARIQRGLGLLSDRIPLEYDGPRDLDELYQLPEFRWRGPARVQTARVMKTWPIFRRWRLVFEGEMSEEQLNFNQLVRITEYAGRFEGLCDDRKHGRGRFLATVAGGTTRTEILTGMKANGRAAPTKSARV